MECLKLTENHIIQRFYFESRADLKTFKRNKKLLVWVFDELLNEDVEKRIAMTKKLFKTNCDVIKFNIENKEAFDDYIITKWD
tara:strand:- start:337 stop:585 length:249 start_codon:yes stop_codon:yes gene_type:complete